ncbi:MAG TPA: hypothetical protein VM870_05060, partial [Pyrinomonadaceae bacterium]|nr:hypothetical protein [Pyrinomonadaceae bacterium]
MNRQNFLGHLALALTIVLVAAYAGQLRRMEFAREASPDVADVTVNAPRPVMSIDEHRGPAEVLVRFKPGTSRETIKRLTDRLNDRLEDRIESVSNLAVVEDEDGLDAEAVAAEYGALPEVEYAEPDYEITLDPREDDAYDSFVDDETVARTNRRHSNTPNDPLFGQQ